MFFTAALHNTGAAVAFFVRLRLTKGAGGDEILPALWSDNYVSLLPGETRAITVEINPKTLGGRAPALAVTGWNVR
jgi:exo-1,4-beta-D-glucosaminidase